MTVRGGTRTGIDFRRLAAGLKGDGIDTRTWVSIARVDEDPDATVWDPGLGWLCDVTFVGGPLDGDGPVLARWGGRGEYSPPPQGGLCLVAVPGGDSNAELVIIGFLDVEDSPPPSAVNGTAIDEALASRTRLLVRPDQDADVELAVVRVNAELVLGAPDADQKYVRGDDFADALDVLLTALDAFLAAAPASPAPPNGAVVAATFAAAASTLSSAIASFKSKRSTFLSQRIKGA